MSSSLREIISQCYLEIRNSGSSLIMFNRYQIAGLVLGKMYELYEKNKHHSSLIDIEFFLDVKNPIKHIKNILDNSSDEGTMTIESAILNEIRDIKQNHEDGSTLLHIIERELFSIDKEKYIQSVEYRLLVLERIESKMNEYRIHDKLSNDDKNILYQGDKYDLISSIIERNLTGESLKVAISDVYNELLNRHFSEDDEKCNKSIENLSSEVEKIKMYVYQLRAQLNEDLNDQFLELHKHIDHVGHQTFGVISSESNFSNADVFHEMETASPIPKYKLNKKKSSKLFNNK